MNSPARAFPAGELGFFGERPVELDPIAIFERLIPVRQFAEDAKR